LAFTHKPRVLSALMQKEPNPIVIGEGCKEIIRFVSFGFLLERRMYEYGFTPASPAALLKFLQGKNTQMQDTDLLVEISMVENQNTNPMMISLRPSLECCDIHYRSVSQDGLK
jgi:hypothetical protein